MTKGMVLSLSLWDTKNLKNGLLLGEPDLKVYVVGEGAFRLVHSKSELVLTPEQTAELVRFLAPRSDADR